MYLRENSVTFEQPKFIDDTVLVMIQKFTYRKQAIYKESFYFMTEDFLYRFIQITSTKRRNLNTNLCFNYINIKQSNSSIIPLVIRFSMREKNSLISTKVFVFTQVNQKNPSIHTSYFMRILSVIYIINPEELVPPVKDVQSYTFL